MAPIPIAPNDYRDCTLYKVLLQKSSGGHGAVDKFDALVGTSTPLLDAIIAGPFRNFTLHNRDHAKKLLQLSAHVIDEATMQSLSVLECMVIAYSAYLHDLGMCITSPEERKAIIESKAFQDVFADWPELSDALKRARRRLQEVSATESAEPSNGDAAKLEAERLQIENELFQLQEAGLVAFLRPRHATEERYKALLEFLKKTSGRSDLFELRGVSFEQQLINICVSHNLDAGALAEVQVISGERFPRDLVISGQTLNTQFCAAVLRITDILDFDRERTPRVLFESLGISGRSLPGAHVSLQEWQKHMAVHSVDIRPNEIVVAAECKHPVIEKAIREFCGLIEREVRDTSTVLAHNTAGVAGAYKLRLPIVVRPQVTSVGYVYKDMSLGMNQVAIMTLLMGEHLYSRKGVALRELIQNAVDACVVRQKLALDKDYAPAVDLRLFAGEDNQTWIEITDNGIGMDEHVLSEYFLKLGNSYYRSAEFHRLSRGSQFVPISRFGIGIASLFMIGDVLEVTTVAASSPRQDSTSRFVRIERMGGLAYVSENVDWTEGTRVRVRLNAGMQPDSEEFAREVVAYLKETVVRPKVSVTVKIGSAGFVTGPQRWLTPKPEAIQQLSSSGKELVPITFDGISTRISGVAYLFLRIADDHLSLFNPDGSRFAALGHQGDFNTVFQRYSGNRITVSGFKMGMKKQRAFHGQGKAVLPLAFDIEIQADDSVVFDVARDRLMGETKPLIVNEFRRSIYRALLQGGVLKRLDDPSREQVERILLAKYPPIASDKPMLDEVLLKQVEALLPKSAWPHSIHKQIAEELKQSPSRISRAISTLIKQKRITKPDSA